MPLRPLHMTPWWEAGLQLTTCVKYHDTSTLRFVKGNAAGNYFHLLAGLAGEYTHSG